MEQTTPVKVYQGLCKLLDGMGNVDDGVESVLTQETFDGLLMIASIFGHDVANQFENLFTQREDGSIVLSIENASTHFREFFNSEN